MVVVYPWACLWMMPAFCPDLWAWKLLEKLEPGRLTWEVLGELVGITVCWPALQKWPLHFSSLKIRLAIIKHECHFSFKHCNGLWSGTSNNAERRRCRLPWGQQPTWSLPGSPGPQPSLLATQTPQWPQSEAELSFVHLPTVIPPGNADPMPAPALKAPPLTTLPSSHMVISLCRASWALGTGALPRLLKPTERESP